MPGAILLLAIIPFAILLFAGCEPPPPPPVAAIAVDSMARRFLRTIESRDLDAIRAPLNARGKDEVTSLSMARTFDFFEGGSPTAITLLNAEIADSPLPEPAERHRLTYRLDLPNARSCYYFFELMIEHGDSVISGFRVEPRQDLAR
ncbi:MAG: hypothetical protein JWQ98_3572 [Chlorobi bacterium]|nr:hypothetical protein [Chlorobiota bacterium]